MRRARKMWRSHRRLHLLVDKVLMGVVRAIVKRAEDLMEFAAYSLARSAVVLGFFKTGRPNDSEKS